MKRDEVAGIKRFGIDYASASLSSIYWGIFEELASQGKRRETRGTKSYEFVDVNIVQEVNPNLFALKFPHNKCMSWGELMLLFRGSDSKEQYMFYSPTYEKYSKGDVLEGAYGSRVNFRGFFSALGRLRQDQFTRRAALNIFSWEKEYAQDVDVACNLALHFLPADGQLNLIAYSRSTDFRRGLIYDISEWSIALAIMAGLAGLEPGWLSFHTSSLHLYADDEVVIDRMGKEKLQDVQHVNEWRPGEVKVENVLKAMTYEYEAQEGGNPLNMTGFAGSLLGNWVLLPYVQRARNLSRLASRYAEGAEKYEQNREKSLRLVDTIKASPFYDYSKGYIDYALGNGFS